MWMWGAIWRRNNKMQLLTSKLGLVAALAVIGLSGWAQEPTSRLSVVSVPDKATLTCNGIVRDATPVTIDGLRPGDHLIQIEKPGFIPAWRTVTLKSGQRSSLDIRLEPLTGLVLLRSVPDGADIEINGAYRGKAPLLLTDLPLGKYQVKASSAGYLPRKVEFSVENRTPKLVTVSMASDSAVLNISSRPAGASVSVNGLSKGVTPCRVDRLPVGENEVVVTLPEYDAYRTKVKLLANQEQALDIVMKGTPASLSVMSSPAGARIYVDDKLYGPTPQTLDGLDAGSHLIRVEMDGCETLTRTVELRQAERKAEQFELVRNVGELVIMARPDGATALVDGVEKGVVIPGDGSKVGKLALDLTVGEHRVLLKLKGYATVEKRVTIRKGEAITLKEILKRTFSADTKVTLLNGDIVTGAMCEKLPNGDVKLETQLGIYKTIKKADIASTGPLQ